MHLSSSRSFYLHSDFLTAEIQVYTIQGIILSIKLFVTSKSFFQLTKSTKHYVKYYNYSKLYVKCAQ